MLQSVAISSGTGKSHLLVALGKQAVEAGRRVRYFTAPELIETLLRGLADNSVGRVIEQILKADLIQIDEIGFAPMDDTGVTAVLPDRRRRLREACARDRVTLALRGVGALLARAHHGRQPARPATSPQRRRRHRRRVVPHERGARERRTHHRENTLRSNPRGGDFSWPPAGTATWPLTSVAQPHVRR
jgi:hypothetical protein